MGIYHLHCTDEGGFYIFHKDLLQKVAKAAKMKIKSKREISDEKREELKERLRLAREAL